MQLPTILTRGHSINRLTAGAIGLALLATLAIGAVPSAAEGRNDETGSLTTDEIRFLEENAWDYDEFARPSGEADAPMSWNDFRFLEENAWDHDSYAQPGGEADAPMSWNDYRFLEENAWDYEEYAQPGGNADPLVSPATLPHGELNSVY